jgi:aerobic-type carbon monoxide dehydrogenase small subunit (CoxS/CutS family)
MKAPLMGDTHPIKVAVNGRDVQGRVPARLLLADFIRGQLGLTGTHIGCEHGVCGACTVSVNGEAVRSCLMLAVQADGTELKTVEGLAAADGDLHPLQAAFREHHALQCGFCTSGVLMTLSVFLEKHPDPGEAEIRDAISGHICRCTGYQGMVAATFAAARAIASRGGA